MRKLQFFLGLLVLSTYFYTLLNLKEFIPTIIEPLMSAGPYSHRITPFLYTILSLPLISVACFIFPKTMERKFSPRTKLLNEPIFTVGVWYVIGYFLLAYTAFILSLFK